MTHLYVLKIGNLPTGLNFDTNANSNAYSSAFVTQRLVITKENTRCIEKLTGSCLLQAIARKYRSLKRL